MKLITMVAFMFFGFFGIENVSAQSCTGKLKVCNLDSSRLTTPDMQSPNYHKPICLNQADKSVTDLLERACDLAPSSVQQDMLTVTQIFIVQDPNGLPDDWGFWESAKKKDADDGMNGRSYIGLLAKGITNPAKLSIDEENLMTKLVFSMTTKNLLNGAVKVTANPDSQELAVLARMAHELGHIKYYKQRIDKKSCFYDPANGRSKFMDVSWDQGSLKNSWLNRYFTKFGDDAQTKHLQVTKIPQLGPNINSTHEVYSIISDGSFVSLFASVSPDEDFVETYKFFALNNTLSDFSIQFGSGASADKSIIIANKVFKGAAVRDKVVNCVQNLPHM
jgi:hypothetical protein